jgi:hypothetical protein
LSSRSPTPGFVATDDEGLDGGADRRDRRAELVGGEGEELPALPLGITRRERPLAKAMHELDGGQNRDEHDGDVPCGHGPMPVVRQKHHVGQDSRDAAQHRECESGPAAGDHGDQRGREEVERRHRPQRSGGVVDDADHGHRNHGDADRHLRLTQDVDRIRR